MILHVLYALFFVTLANLIVFPSYLIARLFLGRGSAQESQDSSASIISRVSTLHALILAFFFAEQMNYYHGLNKNMLRESGALRDVFVSVQLSESLHRSSIIQEIENYARLVVTEEWQSLGTSGKLIADTQESLSKIRELTMKIGQNYGPESSIRNHMLEQIHVVSEARYQREHRAEKALVRLFWMAAVFGLIFIAVGLYNEKFNRHTAFTLFLIAAYTGVILSLNWSLSNPYADPAVIEPRTYLRLIEQAEHLPDVGINNSQRR